MYQISLWSFVLDKLKNSKPVMLLCVVDSSGSSPGRKGFKMATGDVLMILDADLTVPPEDLPKFYDAIASHQGDFINGTRLVYRMEKEAMRFLNLLGNKFFSVMFTFLLGQPLKDTLCGTKVIFRKDYMNLETNRKFFGDLTRLVIMICFSELTN